MQIVKIIKISIFFLVFNLTAFSILGQTYKVIGIVDGDTYDILVDNRSVRIRMDGIDAPERGMPYNKVAKKHLSNLIFGKMVKVIELKKDRNSRIVAKTYLEDGTDVSLAMVKAGYAWHFKKYSSDINFSNSEIIARNKKLGLWIESNPIPPWEVRVLHRAGISTKERFENSVK